MKKGNTDENSSGNPLFPQKSGELKNILTEPSVGLLPFSTLQIYRSLLRMCPASIAITNMDDGTIYDVSDRFCERSGFSRKELIGKTVRELNLWAEPTTDMAKFRETLIRDGECRNQEALHRKKDGTILTCLTSGAVITIGRKNYIFVIIMDITAQKKVEEALLKERNFSDAVMNNLPGLFFIIDEQGQFLRWNKNYNAVTGFTDRELKGTSVLNRFCENDRVLMSEKIQEVYQRGEVSVEAGLLCKDGSVRRFLFNGAKYDYDGKSCILGAAIDIEDLKNAEKELRLFADNLEDANIALRVLMKRRDEEQKEIEEKLQANINELVIPYLKKLGKAKLDERYKRYLNILEKNLSDLLSPFTSKLYSSNSFLTPQEIQIADLIQQGKKTKEIAEILDSSFSTVATHRNNIRQKLKLRNSKTNLCVYLKSLK